MTESTVASLRHLRQAIEALSTKVEAMKEPVVEAPVDYEVNVGELELSAYERYTLDEYQTEIYNKGQAVDPEEEYHWESLMYGFLLSKGINPKRARQMTHIEIIPVL